MLVLSRKVGESITVAGNITVRLIKVGNGRVRIGIEAPPEIAITRSDACNTTPNEHRPMNYVQQTVTI